MAVPASTGLSAQLWRYWPAYLQVLGLAAIVNLLALSAPLFTLQVYDRVIAHAGLATLQALALGMAVVLVFDLALRGARARLLRGVAVELDATLADALYRKLERLPYARLESLSNAALLARFRDVEALRAAASAQSAALLVDLPFTLVYVAAIAVIAPPLLGVVLALTAAFVGLAVANAVLVGRALEGERTASLARDGHLLALLEAKATIKTLHLGPALRPGWAERHAAALDSGAARGRIQDGLLHAAQSLTVFASVAVTGFGALAVLDQRLTLGGLVAANLLTARLAGTLFQVVGQWRAIAAGRDAASRLDRFLAEPEEAAESTVPMAQPKGRLALTDVTFRYPNAERAVLDGADAAFGPGGMHLIVGGNGAGKTTVLEVLQGLRPPERGRVLLDGSDLRQLGAAERARWLVYVGAEPELVGETIASAVATGAEDADPARIRELAAATGLDEVVARLPQGYDTPLGAGGHRLSTGQRQRLALTRALLRAPAVLLLDEPSAHLDRSGEQWLVATLKELAAATTVIVASHGRALIEAADTVVAIRDGRLLAARREPPAEPLQVVR